MQRVLTGLLVLAFLTATANACPVSFATANYGYNYVTPVAVAQFIPVAVPTFTLTQTQVAPAPDTKVADQSKALLEQIKRLQEKVDALSKPTVIQPRQESRAEPEGPTFASLVQSRCAACHSADKAKTEGAGFVMVSADGSLAKLTDRQLRDIGGRVRRNNMPLRNNKLGIPPLNDQEYDVFMDGLDRVQTAGN